MDSDLQRVIDNYTCPICTEVHKATPKTLPCLHTYCKECIRLYVAKQQKGKQTICAICRKRFALPENGVDGKIIYTNQSKRCQTIVNHHTMILFEDYKKYRYN